MATAQGTLLLKDFLHVWVCKWSSCEVALSTSTMAPCAVHTGFKVALFVLVAVAASM